MKGFDDGSSGFQRYTWNVLILGSFDGAGSCTVDVLLSDTTEANDLRQTAGDATAHTTLAGHCEGLAALWELYRVPSAVDGVLKCVARPL